MDVVRDGSRDLTQRLEILRELRDGVVVTREEGLNELRRLIVWPATHFPENEEDEPWRQLLVRHEALYMLARAGCVDNTLCRHLELPSGGYPPLLPSTGACQCWKGLPFQALYDTTLSVRSKRSATQH